MTDALKLKKFVDEHISEFHWSGIPVAPNLTIIVDIDKLDALCDLLGHSLLVGSNIDCVLKYKCIVIPHFELILENFCIDEDDINEIFPNEED